MLIMSASNINKTYGTDVILEDVSFSVDKGDRIGIVGPNGAGKTTLINIITGELEPSSGNVYTRSDFTMGYLKQKNHFLGDGTVTQEAEKSFAHFFEMEREMEALQERISNPESPTFDRDLERYTALMEEYDKRGGYTYRSELNAVLKHMGFTEADRQKKIDTLSGGERTRLALSCMLLKKPDILILDEPTNHLDLKMLEWLESYLKAYQGTILVVSHDRYFLDHLVNRIFDMQGGTLYDYRGNYTEFLTKRAERLETMRREYEKQQKEIARQEEMIRRFKQHGTEHLAKRAASREKRLAHVERLDKPQLKNDRMKLDFGQNYKSGNDVIVAENLSKSFGARRLFRNVSMDIKKGERICIIGDNGIGKTTLLRILIGQEKADDGYLKIGYNVDFGYYDQGQRLLDDKETVFGEMKNAYHLFTDTEMRSLLGRFLFRGDDVFKLVGSLSGGEKAKLSLLKLMLSGANTLVLDEPTNHLDIDSKEVVEDALDEFEGTLIVISHDRYLLTKIPDRILELTEEGIVEYKGNFEYYLEKNRMNEGGAEGVPGGTANGGSSFGSGQRGGSRDTAANLAAKFATGRNATAAKMDTASGRSELDITLEQVQSAEASRQAKKAQEAEERRRQRKADEAEERIHELEGLISEIEEEMQKEEHALDFQWMQEQAELMSQYENEVSELYDVWLELQ